MQSSVMSRAEVFMLSKALAPDDRLPVSHRLLEHGLVRVIKHGTRGSETSVATHRHPALQIASRNL